MEAIELQAIIKERLGREIHILEAEVKQLKASHATAGRPVRNLPPTPPEAVLLSRIDSLQVTAAQARADTNQLRFVLTEVCRQFFLVAERMRPDSEADKSDLAAQVSAMGETIRILGDHIGDILSEKEELLLDIAQRHEEETQRIMKQGTEGPKSSYLRERVRRLELDLALAREEKEMYRERAAYLEDANLKHKSMVTSLGQRIAELEVKVAGNEILMRPSSARERPS